MAKGGRNELLLLALPSLKVLRQIARTVASISRVALISYVCAIHSTVRVLILSPPFSSFFFSINIKRNRQIIGLMASYGSRLFRRVLRLLRLGTKRFDKGKLKLKLRPIEAIFGNLYDGCDTIIRLSISLTVQSQDLGASAILATFISISAL